MSSANSELMESKSSKPLKTVHVEIAKGAVTHKESYSSETIFVVLEGAWRFSVAERVVTLGKDEVLRIAPHEQYSAEALADTIALKITPVSHQEKESQNQYVARPHDDPDQYLWGV